MADRSVLAVAVAQIASVPGDVAANARKHLDVVEAARSAGAGVLVFPEMSLTGHAAGPTPCGSRSVATIGSLPISLAHRDRCARSSG